jgi:dTDP-4-amino-4,6-dideoxygalactose transaminase
MLFPLVIISLKVQREKLVRHLELRGIETRYMMPLLSQPVYKKIFGNIIKNFPVAYYLDRNAFIIGCHPDLTKGELNYMIKAFDDFLGSL